MRKITLLVLLILNSSLIAQTIEENNINRIIVKFKSNVKYETPGNENFFNHKELDQINEENGIEYIIPSGDMGSRVRPMSEEVTNFAQGK